MALGERLQLTGWATTRNGRCQSAPAWRERCHMNRPEAGTRCKGRRGEAARVSTGGVKPVAGFMARERLGIGTHEDEHENTSLRRPCDLAPARGAGRAR